MRPRDAEDGVGPPGGNHGLRFPGGEGGVQARDGNSGVEVPGGSGDMRAAASDNLVREIHDLVATSEDASQASARPPGTSSRELRAMRRDVLGKLRLSRGMSVAEIGCGVCLLGVPVAERVSRYVGLDFAPQAVQVANERLQASGVSDRARALCVDVLSITDEDLERLGHFDRVLMYAVFHYARNEQEAVRLLRRTIDLLAPGGRALVGNIPLEDSSDRLDARGVRTTRTARAPNRRGRLGRDSRSSRPAHDPLEGSSYSRDDRQGRQPPVGRGLRARSPACQLHAVAEHRGCRAVAWDARQRRDASLGATCPRGAAGAWPRRSGDPAALAVARLESRMNGLTTQQPQIAL